MPAEDTLVPRTRAELHHPTPINRDELRELGHLPPNPDRHRALPDALDLTHFLKLLFS